MNSRSNWWNLE